MGEKHPDRTNEWSKQQQALKNMKTTTISSKDSKEEKKISLIINIHLYIHLQYVVDLKKCITCIGCSIKSSYFHLSTLMKIIKRPPKKAVINNYYRSMINYSVRLLSMIIYLLPLVLLDLYIAKLV